MVSEKLGKLIVNAQLINDEQLQKALLVQKKEGGRLGSILVRLGFIDEAKLLKFLSQQYGVPAADLTKIEIDPAVVKLVPAEVVKKYLVVPIKRMGATLSLAMVDPSDVFAIDDIKFMTGYNVEPIIAAESSVVELINKYYGKGALAVVEKTMTIEAKDYTLSEEDTGGFQGQDEDNAMVSVDDFDTVVGDALENIDVVEEQQDDGGIKDVDAPIVKLVNGVLVNAIKVGASDIHVEPFETVFRVRFRIDGSMKTIMNLPIKIKNAVVSRLKIMSKLDIAERRLPQDGRIKLKLGKKKEVDFRVSTLPCLFGEKVVMRILDKGNLSLDLTKLGFEEGALKDFTEAINAPYGMVLVTGPTGSGKTTTLYSALSTINTTEINIMTAEDPVEYNLMGINQVQMKDEIGLNFAAALRSFLRQDPDVVMVGEIRDYETAEIGVKAALTGHLVLSTLHTNDAPGTVNRLLNMGIEPFLVASSVVLILAQRLARRICAKCKEPDSLPPDALLKAGFKQEELKGLVIYKGKGCDVCNKTGYKGRVALYEVMPVKEELRELILQGASADELKKKAISLGMKTLRMSGLSKVKEGMTTIEEVLDSTFAD
ncbi:type IV-A pilus assembly ATPase PilB [Candidatus Manganitrophus noduliformans]|uniref:Type IV-A pilus assembly ATPase PilB n=1 Tax=Candidatus Manganitrophus noduliformans TaxID=2606439 RepID=A0A7X6IBK2_9BACT|nr:type IV-A pilus assembly ATPase PilB [Candidatus Manganitrophus noduliformans]NKE71571.1 type IV-A pilus assembly ATPase PilB [Candidatus Manganitrophus noduliformans]